MYLEREVEIEIYCKELAHKVMETTLCHLQVGDRGKLVV